MAFKFFTVTIHDGAEVEAQLNAFLRSHKVVSVDRRWVDQRRILLLAFFFPAIHDDIDWARGFESLDKELQQIAPKSARGRRYVDKLVKVWRKNGQEVWVLLHVEVQTQRQRGFGRRMYHYNTRIEQHFGRTVVSVAVLADDAPKWRPNSHDNAQWGWSVKMTFPVVKLLDWANREAELEADSNPFARVVLAHLKALETRRNPHLRRTWKFRLVRGLYEQGFKPEDVRQLFRLIDWLMDLPKKQNATFLEDVKRYEEGRIMPFVTTPDRFAMEEGMLKVIETSLRAKFGEEGVRLLPEIGALEKTSDILAMNEVIIKSASLEEVRRACAAAAVPEPAKKKTRGKRK